MKDKIMKKCCIALLSCMSMLSHANDLTKTQKASIEQLITYFKNNDIKAISHAVQYPLKRHNPLPSIQNPQQMQKQFDQIFDTTIKRKIANSHLKDWQQMGWRGVMFNQGEIWITDVDFEDHPRTPAKITAVNYSSPQEQKMLQAALAKQKTKLHASLQNYEKPEVIFKTPKYLIRVDLLKNGNYRYASWGKNQDQSTAPDLILNKGHVTMDGSGGNHHFTFKSGPYKYEIYRHILQGESDADATLILYKGQDEVLKEDGYIVK